MEWETENLRGVLTIKDKDDNLIFINRFKMPAGEALGPDARRNILRCAGCDYPNIRCVKHSITWCVTTRPKPYEHFSFRRTDIPDVDYHITLENDVFPSGIGFGPPDGSTKEFPDFLKQMAEKQYDDLALNFCAPTEWLPEINRVVKLRYLTLMECSFDNSEEVFKEIGRMEQLRGLWLHGIWCGLLDAAAVGELCKLNNFEALCVRTCFPISVDAVRELGKLKNLRALHLELRRNCRIEHERRAALVSALSSLRSLEKLEFLVLDTKPHLSPRDLALPPNLQYLEMDDRVCRLPIRPAKAKNTVRAASLKSLVKLSADDNAIVCHFKGEEVFRIAGDGTTPESRQQLVDSLREMLIHLPPEDGAKTVGRGIAVCFDAPDLAKLIETELAIKVIRHR